MDLPQTVEGRFVRRENRFRVTVEIGGRVESAHLPNSGRLGELLVPGRRCYLVPRPSPGRRTPYDLLLVSHAGTLVSVDARLPNPLFAEAVAEGRLAAFAGVRVIEREVRRGGSRIDFRLEGAWGARWVEVKSVTLVEDGVALFPDAPTGRGRRHLEELSALVREGQRAAVVFVVQRSDAEAFAPNSRADPAFAHMLAEAQALGVEVYAYRCRVTRRALTLLDEVPVLT
ncbi:MAG TPA: DNA/RNA nuclease SfsA [Anaerolineales bacterium]|nr:DNA/RNA nuclease SfsA [Anaerolineales bacterium]